MKPRGEKNGEAGDKKRKKNYGVGFEPGQKSDNKNWVKKLSQTIRKFL